MSKPEKSTIDVQGITVSVVSQKEEDYVCITDIARYKNPEHTDDLVRNWLRNRNTIEFLGVWERLNNLHFNPVEFDGIKTQAGLNSFTLTPKQWIEKTNAIGIISKAGRYGGTYAHRDIALEFASWISVEFKLYLIKELQRLKEDESRRLSLAWNLNRTLSKLNYRIHTDAIKAHLIPAVVTREQAAVVYSSEADVLNVALFGQTVRQWRDTNSKLDGNMRDHASIEQLLVLANIEGMNAEFIHMGLAQNERLTRLNAIAIRQMETLAGRIATLPGENKNLKP
ncbi:KilA-N domain-containing protein [Geminisphaera colitermitum]|uniref:KilA-N domain-containing protein n=1 Tax=Geminisphaera colitermitum TaxID=1148786 RepID=UPI000196511C|nr:KilA-N domain-containing protein [Geminisphaera colitermitum]